MKKIIFTIGILVASFGVYVECYKVLHYYTSRPISWPQVLQEKNIDICEGLSGQPENRYFDTKEDCYLGIIQEARSFDICEKFTPELSGFIFWLYDKKERGFSKARCAYEISVARGECEKNSDTQLRDKCYASVAKNIDNGVCKYKVSADLPINTLCVLNEGNMLTKEMLCEKISDKEKYESCINPRTYDRGFVADVEVIKNHLFGKSVSPKPISVKFVQWLKDMINI